jgi:hypothetical protein
LVDFFYQSRIQVVLRDHEWASLNFCSQIDVQTGFRGSIDAESGFSVSLPEVQKLHQQLALKFKAQASFSLSALTDSLFEFGQQQISSLGQVKATTGRRAVLKTASWKHFIVNQDVNVVDLEPLAWTLEMSSLDSLSPLRTPTFSFAQLQKELAQLKLQKAELQLQDQVIRLIEHPTYRCF